MDISDIGRQFNGALLFVILRWWLARLPVTLVNVIPVRFPAELEAFVLLRIVGVREKSVA